MLFAISLSFLSHFMKHPPASISSSVLDWHDCRNKLHKPKGLILYLAKIYAELICKLFILKRSASSLSTSLNHFTPTIPAHSNWTMIAIQLNLSTENHCGPVQILHSLILRQDVHQSGNVGHYTLPACECNTGELDWRLTWSRSILSVSFTLHTDLEKSWNCWPELYLRCPHNFSRYY